jgi:hypothetical protein
MKRLWCSISSHGFGHAAQMVPVLNELGRRVPGLTALLRTQVPARFFEGRLRIPWEVSAAPQDIGCVQRGPLAIDVEATWAAHRRFHADWERMVEAEAQAIRFYEPALVLSDISYLAIEAGAGTKTTVVGLCNLTWDGVLAMWHESDRDERLQLIERIKQSYRSADLMIRLAPGIPMGAFRTIADVGPVAELVPSEAGALRAAVSAGAIVVDKSSAFRMDPEVPLVVPEINPHAVKGHRGIVSSPNCTTVVTVMPLKPLHDAARILRVVAVSYQAVSGAGVNGVEELRRQILAWAKGGADRGPVLPSPDCV